MKITRRNLGVKLHAVARADLFRLTFDMLSEPLRFFLAANLSMTSTKSIHFVSGFEFSSGLLPIYLETNPTMEF